MSLSRTCHELKSKKLNSPVNLVNLINLINPVNLINLVNPINPINPINPVNLSTPAWHEFYVSH